MAALAGKDPGVESLRDVTVETLPLILDAAGEVTYRRCRHVVTENVRVTDTLAALAAGDLATVGRLFAGIHASLRNDFEVSSPELDALVEIASAVPGVVAARMTGAGFGGCTINLVERAAVPALRDTVLTRYPARTGLTPRCSPWIRSTERGWSKADPGRREAAAHHDCAGRAGRRELDRHGERDRDLRPIHHFIAEPREPFGGRLGEQIQLADADVPGPRLGGLTTDGRGPRHVGAASTTTERSSPDRPNGSTAAAPRTLSASPDDDAPGEAPRRPSSGRAAATRRASIAGQSPDGRRTAPYERSRSAAISSSPSPPQRPAGVATGASLGGPGPRDAAGPVGSPG